MADTTAATPLVAPRGKIVDDPRRLGWLLLAPTLVYIFGLVGMPFFLSLLYSVTSVTVARVDFTFRGLDHYISALSRPAFWTALQNTLAFGIISQAIVIVMANVLALALMKDFRGKWFLRLLILMPFVAPISLGTLGWLWIFDSTYSVINYTMRAAHLLGPGERWYWPGHGIRHEDRLLVFQMKVRKRGEGAFGFKTEGWSAVTIDNPDGRGWGSTVAAPNQPFPGLKA